MRTNGSGEICLKIDSSIVSEAKSSLLFENVFKRRRVYFPLFGGEEKILVERDKNLFKIKKKSLILGIKYFPR